jgi:hypothetical protein
MRTVASITILKGDTSINQKHLESQNLFLQDQAKNYPIYTWVIQISPSLLDVDLLGRNTFGLADTKP